MHININRHSSLATDTDEMIVLRLLAVATAGADSFLKDRLEVGRMSDDVRPKFLHGEFTTVGSKSTLGCLETTGRNAELTDHVVDAPRDLCLVEGRVSGNSETQHSVHELVQECFALDLKRGGMTTCNSEDFVDEELFFVAESAELIPQL